MHHEFVRSTFSFLYRVLTRVETTGVEYIPQEGGCIVATNHMSRLDVPLLLLNPRRKDVIALVADKYKTNPLFTLLVKETGSIWLDRDKADFTAFRAAADYLRKGGCLGIAPEGTRSQNGQLIEAKDGVALLADRARVPVIPVALSGTEDSVAKILRFQRPRLVARYGKPLIFAPIDRADREGSLRRNTEEIMCQIAAMLPPQYRGFYANHARLIEILESQKLNPAAG